MDLPEYAIEAKGLVKTYAATKTTPQMQALKSIDLAIPRGSIFGLLTAVGAEMVGGGFGLGNRLTSYSSMIQMPQFFAVVLILSILGILIYVLFFLLGKKFASWEA